MPRKSSVRYWKQRKVYYCQIDGKRHYLGKDKKLAEQQFHELMAAPQKQNVRSDSVVALIDTYLEWCQKHRARETYLWYLERLQAFALTIDASLTTSQLKPFHVQRWVDSREDWKSGSRRNAIAAVKRVFRWADEQGYIGKNPITHLRKPACGKKETVVSDEHFKWMIENTRDQPFRDLLTVTWETGCRPQESLRIEARHVDLANQRWVIPTTPGKPDNRVVYLTDTAFEITKRLMVTNPEGPIFRNTDGIAWTTDAVNCRFNRFVPKLGVRYCLYALRHTWITRKLKSGLDSLTVAFLAGHKDPSMLAKHYAHLTLDPKHLLDQARKALG